MARALSRRKGADRDSGEDSDSGSEPRAPGTSQQLRYRRLAKKRPGVLTERELQNMRLYLGNATGGGDDAPVAIKVLARVFRASYSVNQIGEERYREMRTLAASIDFILRGEAVGALDVLVCRFKSLQKAVKDGRTRTSRWLELIPPENQGLSLSLEDDEPVTAIQVRQLRVDKLLAKLGGAHAAHASSR